MNKKKIGLIILLITIIIIIALVLVKSNVKNEQNTDVTGNSLNVEHSEKIENNNQTNEKEIVVSTLDDGTLYTTTTEEIKANIVVGDNYFDTQMADINLNFSSYKGKTIEIEGMYLSNLQYTFIGRYSTSNLCVDCPTGYSYIEYEFKGNNLPELKDEQDWIKIIGTLKEGYDESMGVDYYYIDVISLQVMNERGMDTVSN